MRFPSLFLREYPTLKIRNLLKMNDNISECCREGDLVNVKRLIEEDEVLHGESEVRGILGCTPLHSASFYGHLEIVKYLVEEAKVNPESQDEGEYTPLQYASRLRSS